MHSTLNSARLQEFSAADTAAKLDKVLKTRKKKITTQNSKQNSQEQK
jgi:hypothetical protein